MIWRDITSARSTRRTAMLSAPLSWTGSSQPNPFRRFAGARLVELPLGYDRPSPGFGELGGAPVLPLDAGSLGLFLELGLGLSAWKAVDGARWAVRNNPSSGNLHPTEAIWSCRRWKGSANRRRSGTTPWLSTRWKSAASMTGLRTCRKAASWWDLARSCGGRRGSMASGRSGTFSTMSAMRSVTELCRRLPGLAAGGAGGAGRCRGRGTGWAWTGKTPAIRMSASIPT